jgi:hypothetical protein
MGQKMGHFRIYLNAPAPFAEPALGGVAGALTTGVEERLGTPGVIAGQTMNKAKCHIVGAPLGGV